MRNIQRDITWNALELMASGMQLPPALASTIAANKTAYFEPQYLALRDRLLTALIAGERAELTANQWSPITVGRLGDAGNAKSAAAWQSGNPVPGENPGGLNPGQRGFRISAH